MNPINFFYSKFKKDPKKSEEDSEGVYVHLIKVLLVIKFRNSLERKTSNRILYSLATVTLILFVRNKEG